jgi:hypothetical protein
MRARKRRPHFTAIGGLAIAVAFTLSMPAGAQWLKYKTPGIPRTSDGKPDLSAPTPRTPDGKPDLSGLWKDDGADTTATSKAIEAFKPQPWAAALAKKRADDLFKDSPGVVCLPPGPVVNLGVGKIVQTPNLLVMLYGGTLYREIFLDGRELPKDPNPDWMGYSVGHWEGDTLVIESNGFNDRTWIDGTGHPHTEALRVTERIRRPNFGHLEVVRTLVDPEAFASPWTVPLKYEFDADTEDLEYVCNENERDRQHITGKASDIKSVQVSPAILAKYVGTYELKIPGNDRLFVLTVRLEGDHLTLNALGMTLPMTAMSQTDFNSVVGVIKFASNDAGEITHLIAQTVEGDLKGIRKADAAPTDAKK